MALIYSGSFPFVSGTNAIMKIMPTAQTPPKRKKVAADPQFSIKSGVVNEIKSVHPQLTNVATVIPFNGMISALYNQQIGP